MHPTPRAELLHLLMLPDFERADRIGEFWGYGESRLRRSAPSQLLAAGHHGEAASSPTSGLPPARTAVMGSGRGSSTRASSHRRLRAMRSRS